MQNLSIADLKTIQAPKRTKSWNPIPHYDVVQAIEEQLLENKLVVLEHHLESSKDQGRIFGRLLFDNEDLGSRFMMGYRNSIDKSMALGFCAGHHVTVCSNMVFSGDYMTFRKHTGLITMDEVINLIKTALQVLPKEKEVFDLKLNQYIKVKLDDDAFKNIVWDLMTADVLKPSKFNRFMDCVAEERELNEGQTLATVHNGYTRLMRSAPTTSLMYQTPRLTGILDRWAA